MGNRTPDTALRRLRLALASSLLLGIAACSIVGDTRTPTIVYAPDPPLRVDPAWPTVNSQLAIASVDAARATDTLRIAVRPTPLELQVYKNAGWAKRPTEMVEDTVLRTLEDSGRIHAVARQGSGIAANYKLVLDLRRFEADYAGRAVPGAVIEVNAKLLHASDQRIVASRTFRHAQPAASTAVADVVSAFEQALGEVGAHVAGWVLTTGAAHERDGHPQSPHRRGASAGSPYAPGGRSG